MTARATKSTATAAEEIAAIEELMGDLEKRLRRLSNSAHKEASGAGDDVGDFVSQALQRITARVRDSADGASKSLADEAARAGGDAFKKLADEMEQRPLVMLAIVAGIGFLVGMTNRR